MGQVDNFPEATKLVVIGNGMAAGRAMEELFAKQHAPLNVTVFGAEPRVNYNRIMLSPVLSGEKTFEDIIIHDRCLVREAWRRLALGRAGRRHRPRGARPSRPRRAKKSPMTS